MGCGGSRSIQHTDILKEPPIYPEDIDFVLESYPPPVPTRKKKSTIFNEKKFEKIDYEARMVSNSIGSDIIELTKHLTEGFESNLEKVRFILVWLGLYSSTAKYGPGIPSKAVMNMFHEQKGSYAYIFTRMCRAAEVPCVIIPGIAKTMSYQVGDDVDQVSSLTNFWNAVFVEQEWRIVFPLWVFKNLSAMELQDPEDKNVVRLNEYFFLTDPEDFVHVAMAMDPAWQLIKNPYNIEQFCQVPLLYQSYFTKKVRIVSDFTSCIYSNQGINKVSLKSDNDKWDGYFIHDLQFVGEAPLPFGIDLNKYVILERRGVKWTFHVRYPLVGVYLLSINIGTNCREIRFCKFKLFAREIREIISPIPYNPGMTGWGPNQEMEKGGLSSPTQKYGLVQFKATKETNFKFKIFKNIKTRVVLVNNEIPSQELKQFIFMDVSEEQLNVTVCVPKDGEYGLLIFCKDMYTNREMNACNYLLSNDVNESYQRRKKVREDATERNIRANVKHLTRSYELDELTQAIQKFQKHRLDDNGDLTKALQRQEYLELKRELRVAVNRRHLSTLSKSIVPAKKSKHEPELRSLILEAETVRNHLINLNKFAHEIMELCQRTVSEVHSYKNPKPPIHDVMLATFMLLGEPRRHLEEWSNVQRLLEVVGPQSLMSRIRNFDSVNVDQNTVEVAREILRRHNEDTIHLSSPAAATFYVWATNIVNEIEQHLGELQKQQRKRDILNNLNQRGKTFIID